MNNNAPQIGLIMGSRSDWETMQHCAELMTELGLEFEQEVVSAHRTPDKLFSYAEQAQKRGIKVIIAAAGGAAHLPGMVAAKTSLPVIGVPIKSSTLNGIDSLLSIVQMPAGVPVLTMSIGKAGAKNAALSAAAIVALQDDRARQALQKFRAAQTESVMNQSNPAG